MKPMLSPVILLLSSIFIGINSHHAGIKYSVPVYKENFGSALKDVQNQVEDATDQLNGILSSIGMSSSKASMLIEKTNSIIDFLHATLAMTPAQRFKCPEHSGPGESGEMKLDETRGLCYLYEGDADGDSPKTYGAADDYCKSQGGTLLQPVLSDPTLAADLIQLFPALEAATGINVFIGICAAPNPTSGGSPTTVWKMTNGYYPSDTEVGTGNVPATDGMCLALAPNQPGSSGPPTLVVVSPTTPAGFICQYTPLTMFPPFEESNLDVLDDTQIPDSEEMVDVEAVHPHHHHDNEGGIYSMEDPEPEPESEPEPDTDLKVL